MSFTTTSSLRCTPVTLSSGASTLLWSGLLARTCHITRCLDSLPHGLALVLEVFESFVDDITAQGLVESGLIEDSELICEATTHELINRHFEVFIGVKWPLCPRLSYK